MTALQSDCQASSLTIRGTPLPVQADDVLLSQGKPVTTSTAESSSPTGAKAVDGSTGTRWASAVDAEPE
jgi:hypothetical protein